MSEFNSNIELIYEKEDFKYDPKFLNVMITQYQCINQTGE